MTDQITEPVTQQQETVIKQKNPLRIEQGKKLVEYNKRKKEELKHLNEQITKQDNIAEHKPRPDTSTYVYASNLSVLGLAIGGKEDKNSIPQCIGQSHITTAFSNMAPFRNPTHVRQTCAQCAVKTIKL